MYIELASYFLTIIPRGSGLVTFFNIFDLTRVIYPMVWLFPSYPPHMYDIKLKARTFLVATGNPGNHAVPLWVYKVNMGTQ